MKLINVFLCILLLGFAGAVFYFCLLELYTSAIIFACLIVLMIVCLTNRKIILKFKDLFSIESE